MSVQRRSALRAVVGNNVLNNHENAYMRMLTWVAIGLCIIQTGIFSGLNLGLFSVSRLRLEVEAAGGN
jgi:hypothetical protein